MNRGEIEDEASERPLHRRESSPFSRWAYDNAVKVLMSLVGVLFAAAFASWSSNVNDAKVAYVEGQEELTDAIRQQQDMRERVSIIKDRQDRIIILLDDLERRMRALENHNGEVHGP